MRKIPATVMTGFLGAGKTSLIRHTLAHANGRRIALIINEFGDLGVDREVLTGCGLADCLPEAGRLPEAGLPDAAGPFPATDSGYVLAPGDVIELANGCLCCTVADDFLPTVQALLDRPQPPDHILIETSGLALPKPLIKAFSWPEVRTRVTVDGVVAVIDAAAVAAGRFATDPEALAAARAADPALDHDNPLEEVFEDQLQCADLVVLNKSDLVEPATLTRVRDNIVGLLRPAVKVVPTCRGAIDPALLLGLAAAAEDDLASRPSHHDQEDGAHDHNDFESFVLELEEVADPQPLEARLRAVVARHDILRIKGFVAVRGKAMRHVVQGVGERFERYYDRPWAAGEPRRSALVVIGLHGLDRQAIAHAVTASPLVA